MSNKSWTTNLQSLASKCRAWSPKRRALKQKTLHHDASPTNVHTSLRDPQLQIRLLRLHAAPNEHNICATLEVWDKDAAPAYRAISYVCGDSDYRQDVIVNGSCVSVRHNCHYALWQARQHFPDSRVWIDELCINQLDLREKTAQVAMMHEIYSSAEEVCACIGPSDTHSEAVKQAALDPDAVIQDLPDEWLQEPMDMDLWHPPLDETDAAEFYAHFNEFCMRPYFSRVWIVQELAAGRLGILVLCGKDLLDWSDLVDVSFRLHHMYWFGSSGPYKGSRNSRIYALVVTVATYFTGGIEFPKYLGDLEQLRCEDARDRIYSTRAIIDWGSFGQTPPVPDYSISPVELALQLLGKMVDTGLRDVELIARTLDLLNPSTLSQVLEELRFHRLRTKTSRGPPIRYRPWYSMVVSSQMVQQDAMGQPTLKFRSLATSEESILTKESSTASLAPSSTSSSTASTTSAVTSESSAASSTALSSAAPATGISGPTSDMLAKHGLSAVHTDGALSAVVREGMRPGDIVVQSRYLDLVLRSHDDGETFIVVGHATLARGLTLAPKAPFVDECGCHRRLSPNLYTREKEWIHIAIELSDEEALAAVIRREAMENSDDDLPEYWIGDTLGKARVGSHVWDVTADRMFRGHDVEREQPSCNVHRAGEYYCKYQKFFWYSVLMGTGIILTFPEGGRS